MDFSSLFPYSFPGGTLQLRRGEDGAIDGRLCNDGSCLLKLERFGFRFQFGGAAGRVLTGPGSMGGMLKRYDLERLSGEETATDFLLLRLPSGRYRLAGFLECRCFPGSLRLDGRGCLTVEFAGDGKQLQPGEGADLDALFVSEDSDWQQLLDSYTDAVAARSRRRKRSAEWRGWGSWDYYCSTVSAQAIRKNSREIRRYVPETPLIQLDDGYCIWGDWLEADADRFPGGVAAFADEVIHEGGIPGVWLAPFLAHRDSRLLREHPDWFLRNPDGGPLQMANGAPLYLLDYSQPAVCDWWRSVLTEIRENWHIAYFKLDFLAQGLEPGVSAYPLTAPERFHRCFSIVHELIGDAWLLGCSAAFPSCYNLVDGMRQGADISPRPEWLRRSYGSCLAGAFLHRRVWNCDSDYIVLRQPGDEDADLAPIPAKHSTFSDLDSAAWANFVRLFGSSLIAGDKLSALQSPRRDLLARIFADGGCRRCVPLDVWNGDRDSLPSIVLGDRGDAECRLGFFNFTSRHRTIRLEGVEQSWRDLDSGAEYEPLRGELAVTLAPGESRLLAGPGEFLRLRQELRPVCEETPVILPEQTGEPFCLHGEPHCLSLDSAGCFNLQYRSSAEHCVQRGRFAAVAEQTSLLGIPVCCTGKVVAIQPDSPPVEIPVNLACERLYLLCGAERPIGGALLELACCFEDGGIEKTELVAGYDTGNTTLGCSLPWESPVSRVAWHDPISDAALYLREYRLPRPGRLARLRLGALKQPGVFYLVAVTAITKSQETTG